jgi:hypothetical protein
MFIRITIEFALEEKTFLAGTTLFTNSPETVTADALPYNLRKLGDLEAVTPVPNSPSLLEDIS